MIRIIKRTLSLITILLLTANFFLAALNPIRAENSVGVKIRIETPNRTIWQGPVGINGCTVKDTTGKDYLITGAKAACALAEASKQGNFSYTFEDSAWGLFLKVIEGEPLSGDFDHFWLYYVNYQAGDVGLTDKDLKEGDELLLLLSGWPPPTLLKVEGSKFSVETDEPFTVKSTSYDQAKSDFVPVGEVKVHLSNQVYQTDQNGLLTLSLKEPGIYPLYLEKDGFLRSGKHEIQVVKLPPPPQKPSLTSTELKQAAEKALAYLKGKQAGDGSLDNAGTSGWAAIAFGAAETYAENVKNGSTSLLDFLKSYKPQKATDFARQILAALASGKDPRNFGGYDLITGLKNFYNEGQIGEVDLINDDIFGVLALLAAGENPDQEVVLSSAKYILDHQQKDGSFSYSAKDTGGDVDDTAAAIQALALAKGKSINLNLTLTLESAKSFLAFSQNDDGGFPYSKGDSFNDSNSASTSWAIQALIAMGEDPHRWQKGGGLTPYHFLLSLQKEDGSFSWAGDSADSLMTAYALVALLGKPWPIVLPLTPDSGVERNSPSQTPSGSSKELSGEGTAVSTPQSTAQEVGRATKASGNKGSETSSKKASTTNNSKINTKATDSSNASSNNAQNKGGENLKTEDNDNQKKASPNGKTETSDLRYESKPASKKDVQEPVKRGNKGFILLVFIGSLTAAVVVAFSMFPRTSGEKSK